MTKRKSRSRKTTQNVDVLMPKTDSGGGSTVKTDSRLVLVRLVGGTDALRYICPKTKVKKEALLNGESFELTKSEYNRLLAMGILLDKISIS